MKRWLTICMLCLAVMFLTACGCKLDSDLKINRDGSGERVYVVTAPESMLKDAGKNFDEVDAAIQDSCPDCMDYSYTKEKNDYVATFVMPFDSLEDYKTKLKTFCSGKVEVSGSLSDSPFAASVEYSENLTAKETMDWFTKALVDKNIVPAPYRTRVFDEVTSKVNYAGREYTFGDEPIQIKDQVYCNITSIDLYTFPADEGKFSRTIKIVMDDSELAKNEESIKTFLQEHTPAGATGDWEADDKAKTQTFVITINNLNVEDFQKAMQEFTGSADCEFAEEDSEDANGVFCKDFAFRESLDFSNYVCNSSNTVNVNYVVDGRQTQGSVFDRSRSDFELTPSLMEGNPIYRAYPIGSVSKTNIYANLVSYYHFVGITYTLDAKDLNHLVRKIVFYFDQNGTNEVGDVYDKIRALSQTDDTVSQIKTSLNDNALELVFEGTAPEINHMVNAITGTEDSSSIDLSYKKEWFSPTMKCIITDRIDFTGMVYRDPEGTDYWDIPISYEANIYGTSRKMLLTQDSIKKKAKGFKGVLSSSKPVKVIYQTSRLDKISAVSYLCLALSIVLLVLGTICKIDAKRQDKGKESWSKKVDIRKKLNKKDKDKFEKEQKEASKGKNQSAAASAAPEVAGEIPGRAEASSASSTSSKKEEKEVKKEEKQSEKAEEKPAEKTEEKTEEKPAEETSSEPAGDKKE